MKRLGRYSDKFIESAKPGNMFLNRSNITSWAHDHVPVMGTGCTRAFGNIQLDNSLPLFYLGVVRMDFRGRRYLNFLVNTQSSEQKVVWLEDISLQYLTRYKQ